MVVLLALFFHNSDLRKVGHLIASMNMGWFAIAIASNVVALLTRADRWRTMLDPENPPAYAPTFASVTIGYMASSILPVRAGDVVRAALMKKKTGIRFTTGIATVLTERMLDLTSILALLSWFVIVATVNQEFPPKQMLLIKSIGILTGSILSAMLVFICGVLFFNERLRAFHERLGHLLPHRFRDPWMHFFDTFSGSLRIARYKGAFLKVLALTAVTWLLLSAQFYFTIRALGYELPFRSSYLMTGVTIVGLMIPTPGGVGGFHKACQMALISFYQFSLDSSVAIALVFHIVGTAPVVITGLVLFARDGLTWGQLTRIGETAEE